MAPPPSQGGRRARPSRAAQRSGSTTRLMSVELALVVVCRRRTETRLSPEYLQRLERGCFSDTGAGDAPVVSPAAPAAGAAPDDDDAYWAPPVSGRRSRNKPWKSAHASLEADEPPPTGGRQPQRARTSALRRSGPRRQYGFDLA